MKKHSSDPEQIFSTYLKEEDEKEVEKIYQTAIKKLNQEIFKRELVDL